MNDVKCLKTILFSIDIIFKIFEHSSTRLITEIDYSVWSNVVCTQAYLDTILKCNLTSIYCEMLNVFKFALNWKYYQNNKFSFYVKTALYKLLLFYTAQ